MRVFGAPAEIVVAAAARQEFEVMAENWPAVEAFAALSTQWRRAGMDGTPVGLDYVAVEPTLKLIGRELTPALFGELRLMESAALEAMARRRR